MKIFNSKRIRVFLVLMAVGCGVVWSFTNLSYDGEYQIAMAYRLLQGDRMLLEMWEPHQTSAFLPAALMWVYRSIFHTTAGIAVYLQMYGILIRGGLAFFLYRVLRDDIEEPVAFGIGLLYFMLSPKDYAIPDFSNQQLWYSTLLFCCLWVYLKNGKRFFLALSAVWLCLEVLAYPSCLIVYFGVIGILLCYSQHRLRDVMMITGICAGAGIAFCCMVFLPEPTVAAQCITGMLALEPTHTGSAASKLLSYLEGGWELLSVVLVLGVTGLAISRFLLIFPVRNNGKNREMNRNLNGNPQCRYGLWLLCCAVLMLAGFLFNILSADHRNAYSAIFLFLAGLGLWHQKELKGGERRAYLCGSVIGGLGFLATLILTDLSVRDSVVYGLLAIAFSLISLEKKMKSISCMPIQKGLYVCGICFLMLLGLRCIYIRTPLTGRGQICSILSDLSIVRSGPALGLITDEEGSCRQRDSYPEWKEWIRPGDKVWIVGSVVDTLGYLYEDVEVAAPSTMSTAYYCSAVEDYWRLNPDKYPDVIVAEGYLGELVQELASNQWLMTWIEEDFQPESIIEGKYWVYYFRKAR